MALSSTKMSRFSSLTRASLLVLVCLLWLPSCRPASCSNGTCDCPVGHSCEFVCDAPPCHVACDGSNGQCIGACANGDCDCGPGSHCELTCDSEPCHVTCENSECTGECGNGDCTCTRGSSCEFSCKSGPCHVLCDGDNAVCNGQCANGSCSCGPDSSCDFECLDGNCSFLCEAGSSCIARCPVGSRPGTQGCTFTECAAGSVTLCPDGITMACGAECPPPEESDDEEE